VTWASGVFWVCAPGKMSQVWRSENTSITIKYMVTRERARRRVRAKRGVWGGTSGGGAGGSLLFLSVISKSYETFWRVFVVICKRGVVGQNYLLVFQAKLQ